MRRHLVLGLAAILALALLLAAGAYLYLRRSLPQVDGATTVTGITAPVEIVRDADAIPHIFAATKLDGLFGLGYVHAQDRLWQMEIQRRIGFGRLSEVLGAAALPQDRFLRTIGFGRAARTAWASTPEWAKQQVNAYVAGVNAFLASHHGSQLPPEFSLLRFAPEPWTAEDVVVWVKMMAWDLSGNYSFELLRHDLMGAVGEARMNQLLPGYPADGLSILGSSKSGGAGGPGGESSAVSPYLPHPPYPPHQPYQPSWSRAFTSAVSSGDPGIRDFLLNATTEGLGSNNWVVDGTLTASGKPLLANDPHLGTRLPSTWYLAHISAGDFDVIGSTFPGTPAVALGRNKYIAWGATNVAADVEDFYRERLDATGAFYEFRGAQVPITVIPETIVVKGASPVQVNVRVTRHGPLFSDALNANNAESTTTPKPAPVEPLAFRWTALDPDDGTLAAFLKVNEARTWTEFTDALKGYVAPSQNFVYADEDGHIGYYAPGHIPVRASGDGSRPADGWTGEAEWTGWVPFEDLPHMFDPPDHFIVTANNRPVAPPYGPMLGLEWAEPYRAQRITDLLTRSVRLQPDHKLAPGDFALIQADTLSLHAKTLLPILLAHTSRVSETDKPALDVLRRWTFNAMGDSAAAAIFQAWFLHLAPTIAGDDLGPLVTGSYQGKFSFVTRFIINTLTSNDQAWCDDKTTVTHETCDEAVAGALHKGVEELRHLMGNDMTRWRWDAIHRAVFPHTLDSVAVLRPILSRSIGIAGDWSTVDVGVTAADHPFEAHTVPGYREIIDLSPANDSRMQDAVGQSGHPLSPHYDDGLKAWRDVQHRKMRMTRADAERGALGTLTLTPRN